MNLSIGRIVLYKLSESDCRRILRYRADTPTNDGNQPTAGNTVPAIVVWPHDNPEHTFNGQAFLDGNDSLWLTSVKQGDEPGQWQWPRLSEKLEQYAAEKRAMNPGSGKSK